MRYLFSGVAALALAGVATSPALAHAICGNRIFPATLTMDDPGVNDELSLPTIQYQPIPAADGNPAGRSISYGFEFDKTITRDLGIGIEGGYITQHGAGQGPLHGWDNLAVTLKDRVLCYEPAELMMSLGVERDFARTGSSQLRDAGVIDTTSTTSPTWYVGKGLGDLPIGMFRPFALTGTLGYQISDSPGLSPNQWNYAASLQYSIPYLQQHVKAIDMPEFAKHLVPVVEISMSSPEHGTPTGTIAPGILYEAATWQAGVEALIPINRASRQAQGTGVIMQFHLFLDDLMPFTIGKPLIDRNLWQ
ncbi:MAG TPA: hypothetical protein VGG57_23325 [Stellaceae bacterium]|jgi:hypothetical protein